MNLYKCIYLLLNILFVLSTASCSTVEEAAGIEKPVPISRLRFLGEYVVPYNKVYKNTVIGGLSGIDYDTKRDVYYLISDDRSAKNPARFYTAKIHLNAKGIDSVEFTGVTTLLQPDGKAYPNSGEDPFHTPDPEAIRYNPKKDELLWSSEGERIVRKEGSVLADPAVITMNREGKFIDSFPLPVQMHMYGTEKGVRQNAGFEGITFADNYQTLYVSTEEPIYEDGYRAGLVDSSAWIRIIKYDAATHTPVAQYAYKIEPVAYPAVTANGFKINGISDILSVGHNQLLVTERSFSTGRLSCTIRLFLANLEHAADIASVSSLKSNPPSRPASKKLLLNMDKPGIFIDNIEGATFGPVLPNGHRTLLFVADNNFSFLQRTQFLLFEVLP
jgi:hypothetical protein